MSQNESSSKTGFYPIPSAPPAYSEAVQPNLSIYPQVDQNQQRTNLYPEPSSPVVVIYSQPGQNMDNVQTVRYIRTPNDYLIWSIFNTFCCCCLFGLNATIFSLKTRLNNRNPNSAFKSANYSKNAYRFNVFATILGIIFLISGAVYEIFDYIN